MNEAMLIFVSPCFPFCLRAEAVMAARFSFVFEGIFFLFLIGIHAMQG